MSVCCSICTETLNLCDEEISVLKCGHLFHKTCIQQWLDTRMTCPECRCKVAKKSIVQKIYPSVNEDANFVYKGSSDETKTILQIFNENNTMFQNLFIKRIVFLEEKNKDCSTLNSKLEESLKTIDVTMRALQKESDAKDGRIEELLIENENFRADMKTLKQSLNTISKESKILKEQNASNQSAVKDLQAEKEKIVGENKRLETDIKSLKQNLQSTSEQLITLKEENESARTLEAENTKLKSKLSSILKSLTSDDFINKSTGQLKF